MTLSKLNNSNDVLWCSTGFRLEIDNIDGSKDRLLKIEDLNPETEIRNRFSRWETLRIGLYFIRKAIFARGSI